MNALGRREENLLPVGLSAAADDLAKKNLTLRVPVNDQHPALALIIQAAQVIAVTAAFADLFDGQ
jgi:hypothetical protein